MRSEVRQRDATAILNKCFDVTCKKPVFIYNLTHYTIFETLNPVLIRFNFKTACAQQLFPHLISPTSFINATQDLHISNCNVSIYRENKRLSSC